MTMSYRSSSGSNPQRPHHQSPPEQNPHVGHSPIDWASYMNFSTPPVTNAGPAGNGVRPPAYGNTNGTGNGSEAQARSPDQYNTFAQGIALSRPTMNFQHPYPQAQQPQRTSSRSSVYPQPSPLQHQLQLPPQHASSSMTVDTGKSPASRPSSSIPGVDNGLTLDPAAFSKDIRFQMPGFLSTQMGGAPTFPPGGEAWSGVSGANLFGEVTTNITPGQMFSQMFGQMFSAAKPEDSSSDINPTEGTSGMETGWAAWAAQHKNELWNKAVNQGGTGMTPKFSYVNPNQGNSNLARSNEISSIPQPHAPGSSTQAEVPLSPRANEFSQASRDPMQGNAMATSTILLQNPYSQAPSLPTPPTQSASTINIASSSTTPYAPPSNTQSLLTASPLIGPTLTEGPGLYSTTGFDMVGVLARVAGRKDPKTVLGPVDLSCSFAVVDARRYDCPIVYASPTFTALTGYDLPQLLGRNCRFLQSPDGEVVKGSKRKYTDNVAVAHLKRMLNAGKECQASLINYRRGGIPFINLVTVVPIPWDGTDIVYHVGFQVDLVEQPNAILRNMRDGTYQVNYTVANPPQPPLRPPGRELGGTGLSNDVLEIMGSRVNSSAFAQGEDGPKMEWLKMVLENSDDFIHVLSLKGMFQYVSPSVRRVLEYDSEELINKNIADICHPSDIVPLMRELKDSTHAPSEGQPVKPVNLVFRIRRKNSGYIWIECTGRLHVEAGKGRKAVILSGRPRSVPALQWDAVSRHGGLADTEFWAKVSFEGLILHATPSTMDLLGQPTEDVIGQSFFSLLPGGDNGPPPVAVVDSDSSSPVARVAAAFRSAANERTAVSVRHKMITKAGPQIDVVSVFYSPKSTTESNGSSPVSETSQLSSTSSISVAGIKPSSLVVQVKMLDTHRPRPLAQDPKANMFEELETARGTSWQYELHQLRVTNRRIKEQIESAKSGLKGKFKRRNEEMPLPMPLPEQLNAAPRHQLAPGFGLVAPGMPSRFY